MPLAVGGAAALVAAGALSAGASTALPSRTAAQLLADLGQVTVPGYTGTVVQKATLLQESQRNAGGPLSLSTLMAGTNTIKVWYGGRDRERIAVLDATGENDMYRDGQELWQWDSSTHEARFQSMTRTAAVDTVDATPIPVDPTTITPDELAEHVLAAIGPSTSVEVASPSTVAGRDVYRLVVTPPESSSRVGSIVIALDGQTRMPLAAQVYARGITRAPAIDLAFTHIVYETPDDQTFTFVPPPGASISTYDTVDPNLASNPDPVLGLVSTKTVGSGWTRVAVITPPNAAADQITAPFDPALLTTVSGPWGTGKLLQTALLTVLFDDDGRIVIGAVDPGNLYRAL